MERPAVQSLLEDIRERQIDVVVVYKVDRLTRSLADFAKMVEIFDAEGVSFVAVTQQFNTTTSMGRLTLNVLLSFAQFEREVTGERIRDKIAASKKKGMWMGGNVPLGYDASERTLVINSAEAETVRRIFELYRELGGVRLVKEEADRHIPLDFPRTASIAVRVDGPSWVAARLAPSAGLAVVQASRQARCDPEGRQPWPTGKPPSRQRAASRPVPGSTSRLARASAKLDGVIRGDGWGPGPRRP